MEAPLARQSIHLIDSPVSGGKSGADSGTLTLMTAAKNDVLEQNRDVLDAVSKVVFHVGEQIGQGQIVKAALQAMIGCTFAATFESLVMGCKAGVKGETLFQVFQSSPVGSPCSRTARAKSSIASSRTPAAISEPCIRISASRWEWRARPARRCLPPAPLTRWFQTGMSLCPDGDNWSVVKWLEEIAGTEVKW